MGYLVRTLTLVAMYLGVGGVPAMAIDEGSGRVEVIRTPDGGIQPQAVVDSKGTIHLIFFRGEHSGGDLFYARRTKGGSGFLLPIRVNSTAGSAVATGTIRGGQIALGRNERVHVAWNGASDSGKTPAPMLYARLRQTLDGFEDQRNLMKLTTGLDGGGTVAADDSGRVYVAWHGRALSDPPGEAHRRLWVARSEDDGKTFAAERPALERATGACACCGTRALADSNGKLSILFRAATNGDGRDLWLARSRDGGEHFDGLKVHPWRVNACPMSSSAVGDSLEGPVAAWETLGQVYFAKISGDKPAEPTSPPGRSGTRKHPAIAIAPDGSILLAWTEATGWARGGSLVWRLFDPNGRPTDIQGRVDRGIPVWSLPTVVARPDGGFTVIH
jgi:hypothetical protein